MITPIETKPDAMQGALDTMKRREAAFAEYLRIDARLRRLKYLALVEQGFSPTEALILCRGPLVQAAP